ncbi:unnamed protein product [Peniophora sp. CBMAI 1063]|nr:unnamed protein product [Peniophora sp. CBMAI 1063]
MGNGAKAQQKRERNADKNGAKGASSQKKVNEAAKNIICTVCRQPFLVTTRAPALEQHALYLPHARLHSSISSMLPPLIAHRPS